MTNPTAAAAPTYVVVVQDENQISHVVVDTFDGERGLAKAIACVEDTLDYGQVVVRKADGADIGMVDIDGQMVQGVMVTNPGFEVLTLIAIVRQF